MDVEDFNQKFRVVFRERWGKERRWIIGNRDIRSLGAILIRFIRRRMIPKTKRTTKLRVMRRRVVTPVTLMTQLHLTSMCLAALNRTMSWCMYSKVATTIKKSITGCTAQVSLERSGSIQSLSQSCSLSHSPPLDPAISDLVYLKESHPLID
jgi:hypothetical protein